MRNKPLPTGEVTMSTITAPRTQYEVIVSGIEYVENMLATSKASKFYFAGRERTRAEWRAWLDYQRKAIA